MLGPSGRLDFPAGVGVNADPAEQTDPTRKNRHMSAAAAVPAQPQFSSQWSIARVMAASMIELTSMALLWPVFPLWAEQFSTSRTNIGIATTLALGVGLIAARPIAGRLMEGRRRAPVILIGLVVSVVASVAYPLAPSLGVVIGLRALHGAGYGLTTTGSMTAINDLASPLKRGQVMGYFGAINALALILGPSAGWWLYRTWGYDAAFYGVAIGSVLAILPLVALPEPPKERIVGTAPFFEALAGAPMKIILIGHFLTVLVHGVLVSFLPLRMRGHDGLMTVAGFLILQASTIIVVRLVAGRLFDRFPRLLFMYAGHAAMAVAAVGIGIGDSDLVYVFSAVLYGLSFGVYFPAVSALVSDVTPLHVRARAFALFMLAFDLGFACGGIAMGPIGDAFDLRTAFVVAAVVPASALVLFGLNHKRVEGARDMTT